MEIYNSPLAELPYYDEIVSRLKKGRDTISVYGCQDSQKVHMMQALASPYQGKLILTYAESHGRELVSEYSFYDKNVCYYPAKDLIFYQADVNGNALAAERMAVLSRLLKGENLTVVTTFDALLTPMVPVEILRDFIVTFRKGSILVEEEVSKLLVRMGYEKNYQVEVRGQFSIRGGIIDIYDLLSENPYRIELWGDEIESIRFFDLMTQRSIQELEEMTLYPSTELVLTKGERIAGIEKIIKEAKERQKELKDALKTEEAFHLKVIAEDLESAKNLSVAAYNLEGYIKYFYDHTASFLDYFSKENFCVLFDEPARVLQNAEDIIKEFEASMSHRLESGYVLPRQADFLSNGQEILDRIMGGRSVAISTMQLFQPEQNELYYDPYVSYEVQAQSVLSFHGSFAALAEDIKKRKAKGERVIILSPSRKRAERLAGDLTDEEAYAYYTERMDHILKPGEVVVLYGKIRKGFSYPQLKFTVITESDIFGTEKKRSRRKRFTEGVKIKGYDDLKVGDYVIHEYYGIGIYRGIEKIENDHIAKDYMKVEYAKGDSLFVLASSFDVIAFYASREAEKPPKLHSLNSSAWTTTKAKAKESAKNAAKELIRLYAIRSQRTGYHYAKDTPWQQEFEELFPYEETSDQLNAINATKEDMESGKIMDRLICGDVGYGKTEVALRAAFKAVQDSKQVAYLVPTTILAQQHYNTFLSRMKNYPVRIKMLSRFCTAKETREIQEAMREGTVDIVIGTHKLLSKTAVFKDLGLLIIDEEQRFGVTHKEKIKTMKENVDVMTLTATPIPRTLHMSLIGIRDMSVLEEPPQDRLPIQTYVCEYNEEMVREAVSREVARGGQVYYVFNRIEGIEEFAGSVASLVPSARVAFAHGRMEERELEEIMLRFVEGEIDVLVSTTIIETGLDIPNANTMIIHDADRFGLAQLYQLRGRVGRSTRTSYAFLMYRRDKVLSEVAEKRLSAIREFTDLGSGYKIAMRDLEIRGAGNILGREQHGQMAAVGYDLYCKLLEQAIREEQGLPELTEDEVTVDLDVDAYLPDDYISNELQKLDIYKRLASFGKTSDCDDVEDELKDRFGELPLQAKNLLRVSLMRLKAKQLHIDTIRGKNGSIRILMPPSAPVNVDEIPALLNYYKGSLRLQTVGKPEFTYTYEPVGLVAEDAEQLLEETEKLLKSLEKLY
ncbi:MAG: transcription-repair coupling factor [Lachnospiraceae bacterium]|nr:transcription-repair coupling factor [Lachnospiraceae bacterium]